MSKMRIAIDGYNLALPHGTGIATYGYMLAQTLKVMGHQVEGVFGLDVGVEQSVREARFYERLAQPEKALFEDQSALRTIDSLRFLASVAMLDVPSGGTVTKTFHDRLPLFDRISSAPHLFSRAHAFFRATGSFATLRMKNPPDIMHWTYPVPVQLRGARNVYTIHDLVPLKLPFAALGRKKGYRDLIEACLRRADLICTVSETSRDDILAEFSVAPEKVVNTYQISPIDASAVAEPAEEAARSIEGIFGLPHRGYFLFFGAIEPKKNLGRLIEAYLSLNSHTQLVIVAGRTWQSENELRFLRPNGYDSGLDRRRLDERIVRMEYISRRLLMQLVRGARAVTFPSLYEGFGLPVLEAMLLGTPVLSSTAGAIPEIAGDAAVLVDPYDVKAIADGLRRLDQDEAFRNTLSTRGAIQAGLFSQERYRARLMTLYERVMEPL